MNPDLTSLYNYIASQRQAEVSDEMIYQNLLASGWPADMLAAAFNTPHTPQQNQPPQYQANPMQPVQPRADEKGLFRGRIGRLGYLMASVYLLAYFIFIILFGLIRHGYNSTNPTMFLLGVVGAAVAIPLGISLHIRRWHDLDQSGWLTLLNLVPGVGIITAVILALIPGTSGPNRYGTEHPRSLSPKAVFGLSK